MFAGDVMQYDKSYEGVTETYHCLRVPLNQDIKREILSTRQFGTDYRGEVLIVDQLNGVNCKAMYKGNLAGIRKIEENRYEWCIRDLKKVIDVPIICEQEWCENHFEKGYIMEYPKHTRKWLKFGVGNKS